MDDKKKKLEKKDHTKDGNGKRKKYIAPRSGEIGFTVHSREKN